MFKRKTKQAGQLRGAAEQQTADLGVSAAQYLVGGVSSSFRLNPYTGLPLYVQHGEGPYIYDVHGRRFIDFFMGHGPRLPLGHNLQRFSGRSAKPWGTVCSPSTIAA